MTSVLRHILGGMEGMCTVAALIMAGEGAGSRGMQASLGPPTEALRAALPLPEVERTRRAAQAAACLSARRARSAPATLQSKLLPPAHRLADALLHVWQQPEQAGVATRALARAAATRSCAVLRCANLAGEGGPAAGQGAPALSGAAPAAPSGEGCGGGCCPACLPACLLPPPSAPLHKRSSSLATLRCLQVLQ